MSDLLKSLKIEELFQNELKKDKNNKKKKANIFLNLQSKNKSNFVNSSNSDFILKIKNSTSNYINNNISINKTFRINSINNKTGNSNFTSNKTTIMNSNNGLSHSLGSNKNKSARNVFENRKGGIVVNKQSIIVKTNFEMSGRLNKNSKRPTSKEVGSHASASLNYIDNHGSKDLDNNEELSNTYDETGSRITKNEFKELQSDLKNDIQSFRRIIIDAGQKDFSRDDLNKLVVESMQNFKEQSGKNFEFKFAIHTDTQQIHSHIICYGKNSDINFTKEHLQNFKLIVGEKTQEILLDKQLEKERDLTLNKKINEEMYYKFDNSYITRNEEIDSSKNLTL